MHLAVSLVITKVLLLWGILIWERLCIVGTRDTWKISSPSIQFCCEPNTALKIKSNKDVIIFISTGNNVLDINCIMPN
jgi:hypothetical protein